MKKIFVPLICYNHTCYSEYMVSMIKLVSFAKDSNLDLSFYPIFSDPSVGRARNSAVSFFMQDPDNTHLLFLDSDLSFEPYDILKLIESDKEVISGAYPKKHICWDRIKQDPSQEYVDFTSGGAIKITEDKYLDVEYVPPGFLLIKREVIQKIIDNHPELKYKNYVDGYGDGDFYDLFRVGINSDGFYESGSWQFCLLWKKLGGQLLVHPEVNANHLGWHEYSGNFMKHLINIKK